MGEENANAMNRDLNLGPGLEPETNPLIIGAIQRMTEPLRMIAHQRSRWNHLPIRQPEAVLNHLAIPHEPHNTSRELNQSLVNSSNGSESQAREGVVVGETSQKKVDVEKVSASDEEFFGCNICFDLAKDPVVTSCGHLFCWPCLFQWLHMYLSFRECPVCKGHVTLDNVLPIYGRGMSEHGGSNHEIPPRPQARRIEGMRQTFQRNQQNFAPPQFDLVGLDNYNSGGSLRQTFQNFAAPRGLMVSHIDREGLRQVLQRNEQNFEAPQSDSRGLMFSHSGRGGVRQTLQRNELNFEAPQFGVRGWMLNPLGRGGPRPTVQTNEQNVVAPQFGLRDWMLNPLGRGGPRPTVQTNEQNVVAPQFDLMGLMPNHIGRGALRQTLQRNELNFEAPQFGLRDWMLNQLGRGGPRPTVQTNEQNVVAPQFDLMGLRPNHIGRGGLRQTLQRNEQNFEPPQFDSQGSMLNHIGRGGLRQTLQTNEQNVAAPQFDLMGLMPNQIGRGGGNPPLVEGGGPSSSTSAFINSESEGEDTLEIDSATSLSTSSSRRRNDALGVFDVDSGNNRAPRRRRLN